MRNENYRRNNCKNNGFAHAQQENPARKIRFPDAFHTKNRRKSTKTTLSLLKNENIL